MNRWLVGLALVAGCGGSGGSEPVVDAAEPSTTLSGVVTDLAGKPVGGAQIQICGAACQLGTTDTAGRFVYPSVIEGDAYHLSVRGPREDPRAFAPVVFTLLVPKGVATTAPTVKLPETKARVALPTDGKPLALDAALSLTLDPKALTTPDDTAPTAVAGVRVPPSAWPTYALGGKVLAMWALDPFDTRSTTAIGVRITESFGATVMPAVYVVDADTGKARRAAPATLGTDGAITTAPKEGLDRLTWLLLVDETKP